MLEEIMAKDVPNLVKTVNPHIREAQQSMSLRNMKKVMPRHAIISLLKTSDREKLLKATRERRPVMDRGTKIKVTAVMFLWKQGEKKSGTTSFKD